jgi:outer membrane receptor for monomeric catechols
MSGGMLRTIALVAVCLSDGAFATDRHCLVDPAAPYQANRLSSPRANQPVLDIPGQTTVLTRQVLDDMNATSVRDALRSTEGVTVGR